MPSCEDMAKPGMNSALSMWQPGGADLVQGQGYLSTAQLQQYTQLGGNCFRIKIHIFSLFANRPMCKPKTTGALR